MVAAAPAPVAAAVRARVGRAAEVVALPDPDDPRLDGILAAVEFLILDQHRDDLLARLAAMPRLRAVQTLLAGADRFERFVPPAVVLCGAGPARAPAVAEWVVAALLADAAGLLHAARVQAQRGWARPPRHELAGRTVVVLGFGAIGRRVCSLLGGLGVRAIPVARTRRGGVRGLEDLPTLLADADALVVLVPLSASTTGMVDGALLSRLPDGALVVNAARGAVVDQPALLAEVRAGRLRAVLDVTVPEPLPPDDPLWRLDGVTISPHVAGATAEAHRRSVELAAEQLCRYARGLALRHVVHRADAS